MNISTRSRYGLRLLYELAARAGEGPVFLKDIARRQDISEKYLSKLVIPLKSAGIITAHRGAHGGYSLSKRPEQITALEVVTALEGDIAPIECVRDASACARSGICSTLPFWKGLAEAVNAYLRTVTLSDILCKGAGGLVTYEI